MTTTRPTAITTVGVLMMVFGMAEVSAGVRHRFFGIAISAADSAAVLAVAIGVLYAAAGALVLSMKKWAATVALAFLALVLAGRISMVAAGLYPMAAFNQKFAIVLGSTLVLVFAIYIRSQWAFFR